MKVAVLGAGVIGVTTAYFLARDGHQVTVIDAETDAAMGTSFANGGQISPSESVPWGNSDTIGRIVRWTLTPDAPFRLRLKYDRHQWKWLLKFAANCNRQSFVTNAGHMVALAAHSRAVLNQLQADLDLAFDGEQRGILRVYKSLKTRDEAAEIIPLMTSHGVDMRALSAAECLALEPALGPALDAGTIAGGLYAPDDQSGDAHKFSRAIANAAVNAGAEFRFGRNILRLEIDNDHISGIITDRGRVDADAVIVCLGTGTAPLLRQVGLDIPIYPVKGYSTTVPVGKTNLAPHVSITDESQRIVVSRLGDRIRAAGKADIVGYQTHLAPRRARSVYQGLQKLFPQISADDEPEYWTGLRPVTPDAMPIMGTTEIRHLFVNSGHGTLGWTMAAGSAHLMADMIAGRTTPIPTAPYALSRF